jgi:hypothetical protein
MIISENSFIRLPPTNLYSDQVITLNAITFSIDICELSYTRLLSQITEIGKDSEGKSRTYSEVFNDVWSIINNAAIFYNLIVRFTNVIDDSFLTELRKAKLLRHSNQHIDERITEVFVSNDFPIYGALYWTKNLLETKEFVQFYLYAGVFTHQKEITGHLIAPNPNCKNEIEDLVFRSVVRINKEFIEESLSIIKLIEDITVIIEMLEKQTNEQVAKVENINKNKQHRSNLLAKFEWKRM